MKSHAVPAPAFVFTVAVIMLLFVPSTDLFSQLTQITPASGTTQKMLHGHVPPAAKQLAAIGQLPGSNQLNLAIGLSVPDQDGLNTFLQELYDPASPNYRNYLTPEELKIFVWQFYETNTNTTNNRAAMPPDWLCGNTTKRPKP
jgi:hypothetical protein